MEGGKSNKVRISYRVLERTKEWLECRASERDMTVSGFIDYLCMFMEDSDILKKWYYGGQGN